MSLRELIDACILNVGDHVRFNNHIGELTQSAEILYKGVIYGSPVKILLFFLSNAFGSFLFILNSI